MQPDLTVSELEGQGKPNRGAAELAGCDHHAVKHYVQRRDAAADPTVAVARPSVVDDCRAKIEELVERSEGVIRGVVFDKLVAMGFDGSYRTTRRAVAQAKTSYAAGRRRVYRPWCMALWIAATIGVFAVHVIHPETEKLMGGVPLVGRMAVRPGHQSSSECAGR